MNQPAKFLLLACMLYCWMLPAYAQPTPAQWAKAEELVERFCTLSARLAAKGQDDPGAFGALNSHVFANPVNNPVYNDLLPGETETNATQYLSMLRMQEGTLRFDYGAPEWYHAMVVGQVILLAKIPKTITDGFGRTRQVANVLVINVNPTTDEVGKITEIGSRMLENARRRGEETAPANRATLTPNQRPELPEVENLPTEKLQNVTILKDVPWLEMVCVEGGTFQMGSNYGESREKPVHRVTVNSIYMGRTEVTVAQFKRFIDATNYRTDAEKGNGSYLWTDSEWANKAEVDWHCDAEGRRHPVNDYNHPVIHVSWNDAKAFSDWVSGETGQAYRLPTEAEWEYAARGGNQRKGHIYAGSSDLGEVAWYNSNSGRKTQAVAQKVPNELGLYDMSGNVWEWCADWFGENYYRNSPQNNPQGPSGGDYRVVRGGSWSSGESKSRVANGDGKAPNHRNSNLGFRLCRDL